MTTSIAEPGNAGANEGAPRIVIVVLAPLRCGATVVSAAVADAAAMSARTTTLVDLAPPYRSGLTLATDVGGTHVTSTPQVRLRAGIRASGASVLRMESGDVALQTQFWGRHLVPGPGEWCAAMRGTDTVVVDLAWPVSEELAGSGSPAAAWLDGPVAPTVPLLVVESSASGVDRAEQLLAALARCDLPTPVVVVPRVSKVPDLIRSAAGPRLLAVLEQTTVIPIPNDKQLACAVIGPQPIRMFATAGARVLQAADAALAAHPRKEQP
ncbi:MAG: hypothetical protein WCP28_22315 [Actinomycetes bacterium]